MRKHKVYALYGITDRDPENEQVCMFFDRKRDLREFVKCLPGRYRVLTMLDLPVKAKDITVDLRLSDSLKEDLR